MTIRGSSVSVALREAIHRHTTQQELIEHTILDIVHPTRTDTLRVEQVMAIEFLVPIITESRITIDTEI